MPSIRSLSRTALSAIGLLTQTVLGLQNPRHRIPGSQLAASASCPHPQLSCHNSTVVKNLCCFNAPGGTLLQTQFWDIGPESGPEDSWTIHGLWPDNCDGTYSSNCDRARAYHNVSAILKSSGNTKLLEYMQKYWTSDEGPAESFWNHEWDKHGTCISTLEPQCYTDYKPTEEVPAFFQATVDLFKTLPTYSWLESAGIVPSTSKTYSRQKIQQALSSKHGANVYLGCEGDTLSEVWYFFNVKGSVQTGQFVATESVGAQTSCPSNGIKYLPKNSSGGDSGRTTTSTETGNHPAPTGPVFTGNGHLNVLTAGVQKGCIISHGTWYTSGTCATFAVTSSASGFKLKSSKGDCGVSDGKLVCGSAVSDPAVFTEKGRNLVYGGKSTFYADSVPRGTVQGSVFTSPEDHGVSLSLEWQSI